ncbi:hypothetical protein [Bradyrhizobium sp. USDA 3364]
MSNILKLLQRLNGRKKPAATVMAEAEAALPEHTTSGRIGATESSPPPSERADETPEVLSFARSGSGVQFFKSGFASQEPWGVWTIDSQSRLQSPARQHESAELWMHFQVFTRPKGRPSGFRLKFNGRDIGESSLNHGKWGEVYERTFEVPAEVMDEAVANVELEVLRQRAPNEGSPKDIRLLGIGLQSAKRTTCNSSDDYRAAF